jgi:hypothetical protein
MSARCVRPASSTSAIRACTWLPLAVPARTRPSPWPYRERMQARWRCFWGCHINGEYCSVLVKKKPRIEENQPLSLCKSRPRRPHQQLYLVDVTCPSRKRAGSAGPHVQVCQSRVPSGMRCRGPITTVQGGWAAKNVRTGAAVASNDTEQFQTHRRRAPETSSSLDPPSIVLTSPMDASLKWRSTPPLWHTKSTGASTPPEPS